MHRKSLVMSTVSTVRRISKTIGLAAFLLLLVAVTASFGQAQNATKVTTTSVQDQTPHKPGPLAHTFSIVARDPQTGEMGAAVQSHWFAVGQSVIWAEAGVGAVATQSFIDPSYGKLGLELMRAGKSAPEVIKALVEADKAPHVRQVGMVDASGRVGSFTGCMDIKAAGGETGLVEEPLPDGGTRVSGGTRVWGVGTPCSMENYSELLEGKDFAVQANLMASDKVWPAMAEAYRKAKGDLAERMLAALDAAQSVGGDIRGRQSAALIVVKAQSSGKPWQDRVFDVRVDDATEPLKELRRLVLLQRAYNHMNAGDLATEKKDNEGALREYAAAEAIAAKAEGVQSSRLAEMMYWHAVALVNMGRLDESLPLFSKVFAMMPSYRELTPRLPTSGLIVNDPKVIERIVGAE